MRVECTVIGERREAQRLDPAVFVGRELADAVVVAGEARRRDIVDARLDPLDRHAGDDRRHDRDDVARIDGNLVAEAAADVAADEPDLAFGDPRQHRDHGADQVRRLRGEPDRQLARGLVERRDAAAGLERARVHARVQDLFLDRHFGVGERRVGAGLVACIPREDVIGMRALAMTDVVLVGDVLADDRRVGRHRLVRIDDGRQLLVVDLHLSAPSAAA